MSANINPTSNNPAMGVMSPASSDANAAPVVYMNPDSVIEYVESTLANIDGQLTDYQNAAMEKNKTANEWRHYKQLVREFTDKDQTQFPTTQPERNQEIARIEGELKEFENCADPDLKKAAEELRSKVLPPHADPPEPPGPDYGSYPDTSDGRHLADAGYVGRLSGYHQALSLNHPQGIAKEDATARLQTADDALQSLNQDNELTLMRLNTLMQQRVQITTKGTEQLASINQCIQAILQNMRS